MSDKIVRWPSWRYGPKGEAQIFATESDVPAGWVEHPSLLGKKAVAAALAPAPAPAADGSVEVDADGWPWDENLHAATKSKTSAGLWRMKVGVKRPAPKSAQPLDL